MKQTYTPMMMQYLTIKEQYPDTLLLFRLGDFYELFFEDAKTASRELEIALTGRDAGASERVPMCGVPYHSITNYLNRLVEKGYKVAIAEQVSEAGAGVKLVEREVVQVITPGTFISETGDSKTNHYIGAYITNHYQSWLSYGDLATGELFVKEIANGLNALKDAVGSLGLKELIVEHTLSNDEQDILDSLNVVVSCFQVDPLLVSYDALYQALNDIFLIHVSQLLIGYLLTTQKRSLDYLQEVQVIHETAHMKLDLFTKTNLELIKTSRHQEFHGSLLWYLDQTHTAMGSRLLKQWVEAPLFNQSQIEARQVIVARFKDDFLNQSFLKNEFEKIYDMERIAAKVAFGSLNPRDLRWLLQSLEALPSIKQCLISFDENELSNLANQLDLLEDIKVLINQSIVEQPPLILKEGGYIKQGYHQQLDEYKDAALNGKQWLLSFEQNQRELTGIKNLKVGYNRVFGYYIEVSKANSSMIHDDMPYERKQSLANAERYSHPELKQREELILHAQELAIELELELFNHIKETIKTKVKALQKNAKIIATIDVLLSFATIAMDYRLTCPTFNDQQIIDLKDSRHPVIEKLLKTSYVENDFYMDETSSLMMITGPNMGGKSTYMRQLATIVIMAQIGSFVPASYASLPLFDQVFTRIGASDDLVSGQSTFMVEMMEANYALTHATKQSLILFDEIGRGTSTFDGMAIAQAMIEYIIEQVGCKTLFSTHYHELTTLEHTHSVIVNYHAGVVLQGDHIYFTYKMKKGVSGQSYGINVAHLAHLPDSLLQRAKTILHTLESQEVVMSSKPNVAIRPSFIETQLQAIDPMRMSPMDALSLIFEWKKAMKE